MPNERVVYFRADADEQIGAGHLMRCLALADGFRDVGFSPIFVTRTKLERYLNVLKERDMPWVSVSEDIALNAEPPYLNDLRAQSASVGIIVDRYGLSDDYFSGLASGDPWTVAALDDWGKWFVGQDLLINQNIGFTEKRYQPGAGRPRLLLGSMYALLRPEFRRRPGGIAIQEQAKHILVTLGGGDPANHTLKILSALDSLGAPYKIHVVLGPGFVHLDSINEFAHSRKNIAIHFNVADMYSLMKQMDISINGSGSTLWELYYVGLPNILYILADNQLETAQRASALQCSLSLGSIEQFSSQELCRAVKTLAGSREDRFQYSKRERSAVDGRGVSRVVAAFEDIVQSKSAAGRLNA